MSTTPGSLASESAGLDAVECASQGGHVIGDDHRLTQPVRAIQALAKGKERKGIILLDTVDALRLLTKEMPVLSFHSLFTFPLSTFPWD